MWNLNEVERTVRAEVGMARACVGSTAVCTSVKSASRHRCPEEVEEGGGGDEEEAVGEDRGLIGNLP